VRNILADDFSICQKSLNTKISLHLSPMFLWRWLARGRSSRASSPRRRDPRARPWRPTPSSLPTPRGGVAHMEGPSWHLGGYMGEEQGNSAQGSRTFLGISSCAVAVWSHFLVIHVFNQPLPAFQAPKPPVANARSPSPISTHRYAVDIASNPSLESLPFMVSPLVAHAQPDCHSTPEYTVIRVSKLPGDGMRISGMSQI